MKITFYGVRGSIPCPGPETTEFGGNTACVHIKLRCGKDIILDAGTGIRILGKKIIEGKDPIYLLLTHSHWDHIQGFPFFLPIYQKDRPVFIFSCGPQVHGKLYSLLDLMDGAHFPIKADELPSKTVCVQEKIDDELRRHGLNITRKRLNHPGEGYAYRIEEDGLSCVYLTDNELDPPARQETVYQEWVEFCRGADLLIHDGQYLDEDMPVKHGWGHSLVSQARQLALDAAVDKLAIFHHDPDRSDSQVEEIERQAKEFFKERHSAIDAFCSREGLAINLEKKTKCLTD